MPDETKPWFEGERLRAFADVWGIFREHHEAILDAARADIYEVAPSLSKQSSEAREPARKSLLTVQRAIDTGDWGPVVDEFSAHGDYFARLGADIDDWSEVAAIAARHAVPFLVAAFGHDPERLGRAVMALMEYTGKATRVARKRHSALREQIAKEAQAIATRSEQRFARMAESGIFGVARSDRSGRILEANDRLLELLGFTSDDVRLGKLRWDELTPPEWTSVNQAILEELARTGSATPREKEYFRKDGSRVRVLIGSAALDENEQMTFILDVTEQHRVKDAFIRNERVFRAIVETSPDALSLLDRNGIFLYASPAAAGIAGRKGQSLVGTDVHQLIAPNDLPMYRQRWRECLAQPGVRLRHEFTMKLPDGTVRYIESLRANYLHDPNIAAIVTVVRDITETKKLEAQLNELDAFNHAVLDVIGALVVVLDPQGRIVAFNPACERTTGWHSSEVIGREFFELFLPEEEREATRDVFRNLAVGNFPSWHANDWLTRDGKRRWIAWANSCITDAHGAVKLVVGTGIDRTSERELNETLEQRVADRTADLAVANAELESFAHSVSHDLRAPVRAIQGFTRLIMQDYPSLLQSGAAAHFRRIEHAAVRMGNLIDGLLALAKTSKTELNRTDVDLSAMAREIVDRLAREEPTRRVEVTIEPGLRAFADVTLARVVLENLLGNAWKYTSKRDDGHITFGAVPAGSPPRFFVKDDGAGFDESYKGKLFKPFERLHTMAEFPGDGIGLATVERVIRRHRGSVEGVGRVGEGATFTFGFEQDD